MGVGKLKVKLHNHSRNVQKLIVLQLSEDLPLFLTKIIFEVYLTGPTNKTKFRTILFQKRIYTVKIQLSNRKADNTDYCKSLNRPLELCFKCKHKKLVRDHFSDRIYSLFKNCYC